MILYFFLIIAFVGIVAGVTKAMRQSRRVNKYGHMVTPAHARIVNVRKFGLNGKITFQLDNGERLELLATRDKAPISTFIIGDSGMVKYTEGELVSFIRTT